MVSPPLIQHFLALQHVLLPGAVTRDTTLVVLVSPTSCISKIYASDPVLIFPASWIPEISPSDPVLVFPDSWTPTISTSDLVFVIPKSWIPKIYA